MARLAGFCFHHFQKALDLVHQPVQAAPDTFSPREQEDLWRSLAAVIRVQFLENFQGLLSPSVVLNIGDRVKLSLGI